MPMEIRDVIGIFHNHYWRIPPEAVNKNNHLPQLFYPSEKWTLLSNICGEFFQQNVGKFHQTERTIHTTMNKS
jgi:hypothetical protein